MLREKPGLQFGMDEFAIDLHLKGATRRWNQPDRSDPLFQTQEFFRQTDGFGFVVSSGAVFDGNIQTHAPNANKARPTVKNRPCVWILFQCQRRAGRRL